MSFLGASIGHMVISRGMRRDPRWKGIAFYVLASGIAILLLFFAVGYALAGSRAVTGRVTSSPSTVRGPISTTAPCTVAP
jgi:hypothetical protein